MSYEDIVAVREQRVERGCQERQAELEAVQENVMARREATSPLSKEVQVAESDMCMMGLEKYCAVLRCAALLRLFIEETRWWSVFPLSSQDCYLLLISVSLEGSVSYQINLSSMIKRRVSFFGVSAARMLRDATMASNARPESTSCVRHFGSRICQTNTVVPWLRLSSINSMQCRRVDF
jgi:hypothetical protein